MSDDKTKTLRIEIADSPERGGVYVDGQQVGGFRSISLASEVGEMETMVTLELYAHEAEIDYIGTAGRSDDE